VGRDERWFETTFAGKRLKIEGIDQLNLNYRIATVEVPQTQRGRVSDPAQPL